MEQYQHLPGVVTMRESAYQLASCTKTVRNHIHRGELEEVVLPGHKRASGVTRESLIRLIQSGTRTAKKSEVQGRTVAHA